MPDCYDSKGCVDDCENSVKAEISYNDLVTLIYFISEGACSYHDIDFDEWPDMPLGKFTDYLESMPPELVVQLIEE